MSSLIPFGDPMKSQFLIDPSFRNLNHGSYGTFPIPIQTVQREFQSAAESRPDLFLRHTQSKHLDTARAAIAHLLNAEVSECVFVKNATTGVSTILTNLDFQPSEVLVYFDTVYGGVERGLQHLSETRGLRTKKVEYAFPIDGEGIVDRFREVVDAVRQEGKEVKVALFDTIVSMPGFRFPFERLVEVCRELGILSLLDAAHAVGQVELDLGKLKPDFLTSNCHKYIPPFLSPFGFTYLTLWLYTPRSCAVLYVPQRNQHLIRTMLPPSWGFIPRQDPSSTTDPSTTPPGQKSAFEYLFEYTATTDDSAYLCVPAALDFRQNVCGGEARIYEYCESLANEAADLVAEALGTEVLQEPGLGAKGEGSLFRKCAMTTVRLPIRVTEQGAADEEKVTVEEQDGKMVTVVPRPLVAAVLAWFRVELFRAGTFVPVFEYRGYFWTRLSAQVYLERSDFEWLAGILNGLVARVRNEF
ncbi:putative aminotransferase family protein (LolT) [Aspergillus affinis]|uniref:putative aminotransferase family protein (LolT) n=1 Tax=Aspergillus affinis TaxID=1070780 RepID=UPI0022FED3D0|nr:uncharacterized protein KD926_001919 [Aspergillus affinis]KAI9044096.1 hypothetical protein KD926_001919 [Aspergillus affinis]